MHRISPDGRSRLLCFTAWEEPAHVRYLLGEPAHVYPTGWEVPAHVPYRLGGAGLCILSRLGGAGSSTLPRGRSRLMYFTGWEEPAPVLYRLGGADSCTLPVGKSWLFYLTG